MSTGLIKPDRLYHYCGVTGFQGILASKTLWLSDAYYMNDYTEHIWILRKAIERLSRVANDDPRKPFSDKLTDYILAMPVHPYICCFSMAPDLLSQWRAYSDDGAGFAVGFSASSIHKHCESFIPDQLGVRLMSVEYEDSVQDQNIDDLVAKYFNKYVSESRGVHRPTEESDALFFRAAGEIWGLAARCKNHGFMEEKEARIVLLPKHRIIPTLNKAVADVGTSKMFFRVSGQRLTPYFTFPFTAQDVIEVRLGPKNDARQMRYSVEMFLIQNGYDVGAIEIINSEATYR